MNSDVPVFIYGLFGRKGKCFYVGATSNPKSRRSSHRQNYPRLTFRILESCRASEAENKESNLISSMQKKGQCQLNKTSVGRSVNMPAMYFSKDPSFTFPAVRLEPETVNLLKKTLPKLPYRSSTPKIINDAARRGLPLLCRTVTTNK